MRPRVNMTNPFIAFMSRVADIVILSVLWFCCSIPLVTIGTSTSALYYVTLKMVRDEDNGIVRSFFRAFKINFKQGLLITCIYFVFSVVLLLDFFAVSIIGGVVESIGYPILLILTLGFFATLCFTFPFLAQFENNTRGIIKGSFLLTFQKISNTVLIIVLNLLPYSVFFFPLEICLKIFPIWIMFVPSTTAYLCSKQFVKIYDPFIQQEESME